MTPELFDVIELLTDLPAQGLRLGARGAIVQRYADDAYEVEFTDENGETQALCTLSRRQFVVVWRAATRTWVSTAERVAALVDRLPEKTGQEVFDFALFLHAREQSAQTEASPQTASAN